MTTSPPTTTSAVERARAHSPRQLAAASIGNLVEWYDWYAYSFLAVYFATQVFPESESGLTALLNTFAIFAVGFFFRPIGGLLMGAVADRFGRKPALTATILLMGAGVAAHRGPADLRLGRHPLADPARPRARDPGPVGRW